MILSADDVRKAVERLHGTYAQPLCEHDITIEQDENEVVHMSCALCGWFAMMPLFEYQRLSEPVPKKQEVREART